MMNKPPPTTKLNQNEQFNLQRQKNLKQTLRNNLMNLDLQSTNVIGIDKFQIESEELKIKLTKDELVKLVKLYESKEHFNKLRNCPAINYDKAIKSIVPVLSKN